MTADDAPILIAKLATALWRMRRRFVHLPIGELPDPLRRSARDVEAMMELLHEHAVEVQDHTGDAYDATLSLRVAAFEPRSELEQERVLETLQPTVYYWDQRIQVGEVIVGIPERASQ